MALSLDATDGGVGVPASPPSSQHSGHVPSFLLLQNTQPFQPQDLCTPCYLTTTSPRSFPLVLQASVPVVHPEGLFSDPITSSILTYARSSLSVSPSPRFLWRTLESLSACPLSLPHRRGESLRGQGLCILFSPVPPAQRTVSST